MALRIHFIVKQCRFANNILNKRFIHQLYGQEKDPAPIFFDNEVQKLLKTISRPDINKIFSKKKLGSKGVAMPTYKFMSEDQLQQYREKMNKRADEILQMPPVVKVREPIENVLCEDPALDGLDTAKWLFTDISFGIKPSQRIVVVRETNGTLREADWDTKDRVNQIYFPTKHKKLTIPEMFKDEYLKKLLDNKEYVFILDNACLQFEPNSEQYQQITSITYEHINDNNMFNLLRSTRHFGPMVFYLSWFKIIDNLLLELISTSQIDEAHMLMKIYVKQHNADINLENPVKSIESYIAKYCTKKGHMEIALQAYLEKQKELDELQTGIKSAHGIK